MMIWRLVSITVFTLTLGVLAPAAQQQTAQVPITEQVLLEGLKNPSRWLTFSGDYSGQRHSPLKQVTPQNVSGLTLQWVDRRSRAWPAQHGDDPSSCGRGSLRNWKQQYSVCPRCAQRPADLEVGAVCCGS